MQIHPRTKIVGMANAEFGELFWGIIDSDTIADKFESYEVIEAYLARLLSEAMRVYGASEGIPELPKDDHDKMLWDALSGVVKEFELTTGEIVRIISDILGSCAKYHIRVERHPEKSGKGGDEA